MNTHIKMINSNPISLHNKLALITGGGTGLGLAMAMAFSAQGARVIISGRREDVLEEAAKKTGSNVYGEVLDITCFEKIPEWVSVIEKNTDRWIFLLTTPEFISKKIYLTIRMMIFTG
ncbi:MAG: SDR family NAD(P)-dependent oxidoreductase [Bacteroidetes bacterium]|nr:SDR family NAD(P)-dependent oxidoreductase [Bacteroidota bacterium]